MNRIRALLANALLWRILGALLIGALIWFVGPLVQVASVRPLGNPIVRLVCALAPLVLVLVLWALAKRRAAARNAALVADLSPGAADVSEAQAKLAEALSQLRTLRLGNQRAYLYELPWYVIIGPEKAGKTTALLNSGLGFPTAVAGEYRALRGQPDTPNCDWWLTDEAVLIDTAGRYLSQHRDAAADAEGWRGFLGLLKKHRPLQPLNGIFVALPATDLSDQALIDAHIANIRARLAEIREALGQDLPVYLLVTKADLLSGFREYFARATDAEAAQVLGATGRADLTGGAARDDILLGFDKLVESLAARVVDRVQLEPQLPYRAEIAAFPQQVATLKSGIARLLQALAEETRYNAATRVRGVYLTSGTQTGNPVDRILMSLGAAPSGSADAVGRGRSYFLRGLFSALVFPEAGLSGRDPAAVRRQAMRRRIAMGAGVAVLAVVAATWVWGYLRNEALVARVDKLTTDYVAAGGGETAGSPDLVTHLPALNVLGDGLADLKARPAFGLGLGQRRHLVTGVGSIYQRDLERRLAPNLAALAAARITGSDAADPGALYDDLKTYLILAGQGPAQSQHVSNWISQAWLTQGAGGDPAIQAASLARHGAAMLAGPYHPGPVDQAAVDSARTTLRNEAPAVRIYGRLKSRAMAQGGEVWSAKAHAGSQPQLFFDMGGALGPGSGVPALFTREGYDKIFRPMLDDGPKLLDEERWVVGDSADEKLSPADMTRLKDDLERLYFEEFLSQWRNYFTLIRPRPAATLAENLQRLRGASGPESPLAQLLRAIASVTDFSTRSAAAGAASAVAKKAGALGPLLGSGPGAASAARAQVVAEFLPLREFVGQGAKPAAPGTTALDAALAGMGQLADKLTAVQAAGGAGDASAQTVVDAKTLIAKLEQDAQGGMPQPAAALVHEVSRDAATALTGERRAQLDQAVSGDFGEVCHDGLVGKFPASPTATGEMSLVDFTRLFAPASGAFPALIKQIGPAIDTGSTIWKPAASASEIGLSAADVSAMQTAQTLGRTFFGADPQTPQLTYQIEPVAVSGATQVVVIIDGQSLTFSAAKGGPVTFDWPGRGGASVEFSRDSAAGPTKSWPGSWSAFRLMQAAHIRALNATTAEGRLEAGGAVLQFRVRTFGVPNPFVGSFFQGLRCPAVENA